MTRLLLLIKINNMEDMTFSRLALALARDYESIYYLNMENSHYTEYSVSSDGGSLQVIRKGENFFTDSVAECEEKVYPADQEKFLSKINRDTFQTVLTHEESFTLNYRLMKDGMPYFYQLKTVRGGVNEPYLVIGVRNVDTSVRHELDMAAETEAYSQIATAMLSRYEALYYVDIITDEYIEYTTSEQFADLPFQHRTNSFFEDTLNNIPDNIFEEDIPLLMEKMQKGKLLYELEKAPSFSITYRLLLDGKPAYMNLRASKPKNDNHHIIIGVTNINQSVEREREYKEALTLASRDALTGVKNKRAYFDVEHELNDSIDRREDIRFAVLVCDVNDLKKVNDAKGHIAGDAYIKTACTLICRIFKHSPVFRIGGDEFAALLRGDDYEHYEELFEQLRATVISNQAQGDVVIASGIAIYDPDIDQETSDVFMRADRMMYKNKQSLKAINQTARQRSS